MIQLYIDFPSYIASKSVKKIPIVGRVATAAGTVFVQRGGGDKEQRAQVLKNLIERQMQAERGERPIINMYPEGCTTNGSCIVKMKKGAFQALRPLKIQTFKFKQHFTNAISYTQDVVGFEKH